MVVREFTDQERRAGLHLMAALECFREIRHTMPLQYVLTFLLVALDEGKSVGEYATKAGVSPSVMSRHIIDIGSRNRDGGPGFDLVASRLNYENLREHSVFLTDKGRSGQRGS